MFQESHEPGFPEDSLAPSDFAIRTARSRCSRLLRAILDHGATYMFVPGFLEFCGQQSRSRNQDLLDIQIYPIPGNSTCFRRVDMDIESVSN